MPKRWLFLLLTLLLAGCVGTPEPPGGETRTETSASDAAAPAPETVRETTADRPGRETAYGYTYGQPSGNRIVEGVGDLPNASPVDVQLSGAPVWVVGVPLGDDTAWVVALEDGRVEAFRLRASGEVVPEPVTPDRLPPGAPPLAKAEDGALRLVTSQNPQASELTHPVPASGTAGSLLGVEADGELFAGSSGAENPAIENLPVIALPDARLVESDEMVAMLSDPTDSYEHGVLGDGLEASAMTLLQSGENGDFEAGQRIPPESGGVFESIFPLWFGLQGVDEEILGVMESVEALGSRISVYGPDGALLAADPFIGEPMRWRHLLAAGPFGPDGEVELVAVRTHHIGGVVEFYETGLTDGTLDITATLSGYTSHRIYTRNFDSARAGDLDGDGRWELLVPNQDYTELGAVRHEESGASVAWTLPVGGTVVTNLASATGSGGRAQVAAGRSDGVLRIWP